MCDSSMADSASFSSLLRSVLTSTSSTVNFQGRYETSRQDIKLRTNPRAEAQLNHQAECANNSCNMQSLAPTATSVSHSAPELLLMQTPDRGPTVPETTATDGYSWRKYGQKQVKSSKCLRSYYKCSHSNCYAKKKVQRCDHSGQVIDTIYIGQHSHDLSRNMCNISQGPVSVAASSHIFSPLQNLETPICWEDAVQPSVYIPESEQPSSSSSNFNIGIKAEEQNGNELESKVLDASQQKKNCGTAKTEANEKHGAKPRPLKRIKESSVYPAPVLKANKENKIILHAAADGSMSSDGFRWRKYGQKMVKGNSFLRSYYRCSSAGCPSRKHVETASDDATTITVKYEGKHDHDMPVPKKHKGSESFAPISSATTVSNSHCNQRISSSSKWPVEREEERMDEKVLELGGEVALESARTLLSMAIQL
ncbi:probable WRKY transcription factor 32 [Mercurialis annua]|uniref:probable WRKY transcription factor 32 n=1 Tax=Mercurialis annua TaxID=3986 RepID=UPI002160334D|nr:probable WRKY transcription factor 32 [Mercurialis annua]